MTADNFIVNALRDGKAGWMSFRIGGHAYIRTSTRLVGDQPQYSLDVVGIDVAGNRGDQALVFAALSEIEAAARALSLTCVYIERLLNPTLISALDSLGYVRHVAASNPLYLDCYKLLRQSQGGINSMAASRDA